MAKKFKTKIKHEPVHFFRIETGATIVGVPDWYLRSKWKDIWIEAKEIKRWPVKPTTRITIPFRPGQYNWIVKHQEFCGKVLLAVTYKDKWYFFYDIRLNYTQKEFEFLNILPDEFNNITGHDLLTLLNSL